MFKHSPIHNDIRMSKMTILMINIIFQKISLKNLSCPCFDSTYMQTLSILFKIVLWPSRLFNGVLDDSMISRTVCKQNKHPHLNLALFSRILLKSLRISLFLLRSLPLINSYRKNYFEQENEKTIYSLTWWEDPNFQLIWWEASNSQQILVRYKEKEVQI